MTPPIGPLPEGPVPAGAQPEIPLQPLQPLPINVPISDAEQEAVKRACNSFKEAVRQHALQKKLKMRDCYAYSKSVFIGNDLPPVVSTNGDERSANKDRLKIFIPKIRQQVKTIYSYLKLVLFPNDDDYFRVRAKTAEGVLLEETLTEGLKYVFKEARITEKLGLAIQNMIVMSNAAVLPTIKDEIIYEWRIDPMTQQYMAVKIDTPPMPDLEVLNPLHFYVDPDSRDMENAKWGYFGRKRKQEIIDSNLYFNKDDGRLKKLAKKLVNDNTYEETRTREYTDLNSSFQDVEEHVDYDLYYFPFLKTDLAEYRNILVGIAGQELVVRFHPNVFPRGMNPAVFCGWMPDPQSPYGIGPVEDMMEIQRCVNFIYNYVIDVLSRIGNRFAIRHNVDLEHAFGAAASFFRCDNPRDDVVPITGDYAEPAALMNFIGTLSAELQQVAGAQNPFQGSSNIDFKKTATELQILQENSISVAREVAEHISVFVQRTLLMEMYLCATHHKAPIQIRITDPATGKPQFVEVDFSVLQSGDYTIELTNINPSQSKQAQVETLTKLVELITANPMVMPIMQPVLEKIAQLQGLKDGPEMLRKIVEMVQGMPVAPSPVVEGGLNEQEQQGIPVPEIGTPIAPESGMV